MKHMGLLSRLSSKPRVYCLTLPGSMRHVTMSVRLNNTALPYEFVYGDDHPKLSTIEEHEYSQSEHLSKFPDRKHDEYIRGIVGCRRGVRRLMEKAILDCRANGNKGFVFCNDDVEFNDSFESTVDTLSSSGIKMCGLIYHPNYKTYTESEFGDDYPKVTSGFRFEWCMYISVEYAKHYITALDTLGCESDVAWERYCTTFGLDVHMAIKQVGYLSHEARLSTIAY